MLRFLKLKVIINGKIIYPVDIKKPVITPLVTNRAQIVVTDGFHMTSPLDVTWQHSPVQQLNITCIIEDEQLIMGFLLQILFYAAGLSSDILLLKVMSFAPVLLFLYLYYIKRREFIRVWML